MNPWTLLISPELRASSASLTTLTLAASFVSVPVFISVCGIDFDSFSFFLFSSLNIHSSPFSVK